MLGSSRVVTQSNGVVCYDADFYPYGGERAVTNTCPQNYKFEGKERDTETGNDDFGARYYSNRFGRWLSADWSAIPVPVPYANLTNPQTLNLYAMVADDPESFADLDGHGTPGSSQGTNPDPSGPQEPSEGCPSNPGINPSSGGCNKDDAAIQTKLTQDEKNKPVNIIKDIPVVGKALNFLVDGDNVAQASKDLREGETTEGKIGEGLALGLIVAINVLPGAGEAAKGVNKGAELAGAEVARLTESAEKLYPKLAGKVDLHHIKPLYLGGAKNGEKVAIPKAYHQLITNEFRKLASYGPAIKRSAGEVASIMKQVYDKFPLP